MSLRIAQPMTLLAIVGLLVMMGACDTLGHSPSPREVVTVSFDEQPDDWSVLFTNYVPDRLDDFDLESGYRSLPTPLDTTASAFYLAGTNRSSALNMYLKHRVGGLKPETTYEVSFDVSFATEVPSNCAGIGSSPGEGVTVHATASTVEPRRDSLTTGSSPYTPLNLAQRYTDDHWYRDTQFGTIANSRDCEDGYAFEMEHLRSDRSHARVTTDNTGHAWILVGTRSGFESRTRLYYTEVQARFYEAVPKQ
jgi:hypothetical protein